MRLAGWTLYLVFWTLSVFGSLGSRPATATDISLPAGITPEWIAAQIKLNGDPPVVEMLNRQHGFERVLKQMRLGKAEWIALAPTLAPGVESANISGKLSASLALALLRNPGAVLAVLAPNTLSASEICSAPFSDTDVKDLSGYLREAIKAVEPIQIPKLADEKFFCLENLKQELEGPRVQPKKPEEVIPTRLTPKWIDAQIKAHDAKYVVNWLEDKNRYQEVMNQIERGKADWIAFVSRLSEGTDGATSEDLTIALALALPRNPRAVLEVITPRSYVCDAPLYDHTVKDYQGFLKHAIKAVETVETTGNPMLEHNKSLCLDALGKAAAADLQQNPKSPASERQPR